MDRAIPRWQYRFDNDRRPYGLLRDAIELSKQRPLTDLEREGAIQRFEISWELSWKLMKDLLSADASFGSRATGCARPDSDIDLVLYGDVDVDGSEARKA